MLYNSLLLLLEITEKYLVCTQKYKRKYTKYHLSTTQIQQHFFIVILDFLKCSLCSPSLPLQKIKNQDHHTAQLLLFLHMVLYLSYTCPEYRLLICFIGGKYYICTFKYSFSTIICISKSSRLNNYVVFNGRFFHTQKNYLLVKIK